MVIRDKLGLSIAMQKNAMALLAIVSLMSCRPEVKTEIRAFTKPDIQLNFEADSIIPSSPGALTHSTPRYIGKFGFHDTVVIAIPYEDYGPKDSTRLSTDLERHQRGQFTGNGFLIIADYDENIPMKDYQADEYFKNYYPVYIPNETSVSQYFMGKDDRIYAIQEALDQDSAWRPLEHRFYDFCGLGHWRQEIQPGEFAMLLMPKYSGQWKTQLRVRVKIRDNVYVSSSFEGEIDSAQFLLEPDLRKNMQEDPASYIGAWFFGAVPREFDNFDFLK